MGHSSGIMPFAFLLLVAIAEVIYLAYASPQKLWRLVVPLALAFFASLFYHEPLQLMLASVVIMAFFVVETGGLANFVALPFALYSVFLLGSYGSLALLLALFALLPQFTVSRNRHEASKQTEIRRDLVHASLGVLAVVSLIIFGLQPTFLLISIAVCIALALGTYAKMYSSSFSKFLLGLERSKAPFGFGAFWLAFSLLLASAFAKQFAPAIFVALMIGDPVATIVGSSIKRKHSLTYNKNKSVEGAIAFFAVAAFLSFFFVGLYSLLFAFLGAATESVSKSIDDNLSIGVVLTALALLLLV